MVEPDIPTAYLASTKRRKLIDGSKRVIPIFSSFVDLSPDEYRALVMATPKEKSLSDRNWASAVNNLFDDVLQVKIGPALKNYTVHRQFLFYHSSYFRAAFNTKHGFKESRTGVIEQKETEPQVFELFLLWIYTGNIPTFGQRAVTGYDAKWKYHTELVYLYAYADMVDVKPLQNAIISRIADKSMMPSAAKLIWKVTPENDPLRRYIVHHVAYRSTSSDYRYMAETKDWFESEFLIQVIIAQGKRTEKNFVDPLTDIKNYFHKLN